MLTPRGPQQCATPFGSVGGGGGKAASGGIGVLGWGTVGGLWGGGVFGTSDELAMRPKWPDSCTNPNQLRQW